MYEGSGVIVKQSLASGAIVAFGRITRFEGGDMVVYCVQNTIAGDGIQVYVTVDVGCLGELLYEGYVKRVIKDRLEVEKVRLLERVQRRNEARAVFCLETDIYQIYVDQYRCKYMDEAVHIVITDISAGGLQFMSMKELKEGDKYKFEFPAPDGPILIPGLRIVRRFKNKDIEEFNPDTGLTEFVDRGYSYGCSFEGMSDKQHTLIRKFVYKTQIEKMREKNNPKVEKAPRQLVMNSRS